MSCFVASCKNLKRLLPVDSDISFHRFPRDQERFRSWLTAIGILNFENITWRKTMFICSRHFKYEDIQQQLSIRGKIMRWIKKTAIPMIEPVSNASNKSKEHSVNREQVSSQDTESSTLRLKTVIVEQKLLPQLKVKTGKCKSPLHLSEILERLRSEHNYGCSPSEEKVAKFNRQHEGKREKLYRAKKKINRLKKAVTHLKFIIKSLKSKYGLSNVAIKNLEKPCCGEVPDALMAQILKSYKNREEFPGILKKLLITFHFHSSKGYDYVRRNFNLALLHPITS